jgi:PAS domain S-box-containing protein
MTSESTLDIRPAAVRWATVAALLAAGGYLLARYVGVGPPGGPWAYWPIQGLLCGILFRRPLREWAYIVVATVVAQVLTIDIVRGNLASGATPFGAAAGAAQAMLGAWILRRQSLGDSPLESPTVLAWFVAVGVAFVPLVMSPLSAAAFSRGLDLPFRAAWGPLFVGNSLSMLLFAPLTMQRWSHPSGSRIWLASGFEEIACLASLVVVTFVAFANGPFWLQYVALPYAVFPLLAWSALRCGPRWTATSIITLATIAAWSTARGHGPFVVPGVPSSASVFQLQTYLAFVAFTGLLLSALTEHRRRTFIRTSMDEAIRSAFFESSAAVIALKDVQGRYLMVNRAAEDAYQMPRARLLGREPTDFLDPESARTIAAHDARTLERGEPLQFEETLRDGERVRHFLMTRFPVRDVDGVVRYLGTIGHDETLERELSAKLQRAQRVELVGQMAAGLAHDINNLLFVLLGNAEHLRAQRDRSVEEREILQEMADAGAQATRLTARLMSLGRAPQVVRQPVIVDDILRELEPLLNALVRGRIRLTLQLGTSGAAVMTDPTMVEQIVLNLVANARDAIPGDGDIAITSEVVGPDDRRMVRLRIADTGTGMDGPTQAHIFEPFFTTKQGASGTGLGLYTVSLLVQQVGGSIGVDSEAGAGTRFTVDLPLA